jgi:hypothetical protein
MGLKMVDGTLLFHVSDMTLGDEVCKLAPLHARRPVPRHRLHTPGAGNAENGRRVTHRNIACSSI